MFYKIQANVVEAYDGNMLIDRKERSKHKLIEMVIYSKDKNTAIGKAATKLMAEGYSHDNIKIVNQRGRCYGRND